MCNFEIFAVNRGDDELSNETKYETIRSEVDRYSHIPTKFNYEILKRCHVTIR